MPVVEVAGDRELFVFDGRHARRFPPHIKRQVAADREEPRRETVFERRRILTAQAQERFLHDVASRLQIPEKPFRVAD